MNPSILVVGRTYYLVTFADVQQTMPGIEPIVFIGVDVFGPQEDNSASKYYFQDAPSFSEFGIATEQNAPVRFDGEDQEEEPEYYVSGHEAAEIGWTIVDLPGVVEVVSKALELASQLGYPDLKRAQGKWHRDS